MSTTPADDTRTKAEQQERSAHSEQTRRYLAQEGPVGLYKLILDWFLSFSNSHEKFDHKRWKNYARLAKQLKTEQDALELARRMIASVGDPLNVFMSGNQLAFDQFLSTGDYLGCGMVFYPAKTGECMAVTNADAELLPRTNQLGYPVVARIVPASPAALAGFLPGDVVSAIDAITTRGKSIPWLANKLDGKLDQLVAIRRAGSKKRDYLQQKSVCVGVAHRRFEEVGYIRISTFYPTEVPQQVAAAMEALGDCKAIIVDLRGTPGGRATVAAQTVSLFLDQGVVNTMKFHTVDGESKSSFILAPQALLYTTPHSVSINTERFPNMLRGRPLVILIDGNTRSAPECFTMALVDHGVAITVGARSFGKGIVQTPLPVLDICRMEIATGRWFSPKGTWIGDGGHSTPSGIVPDFCQEASIGVLFGETGDLQLQAALKLVAGEPPRNLRLIANNVCDVTHSTAA